MTDLRPCCQQALLDGFSLREHKPWRVAVPQLGSTDWHTQKEALDYADQRQTAGFWVTVRYWSEGKWERYGTFAPAAPPVQEPPNATGHAKGGPDA